MKRNKHSSGFTLIELLMVIAIIGILAGILIPTVGGVRKQAKVAASKNQLSNYVNAVQMFKGEYGYYPFADAQTSGGALINSLADDFVETISGRDSSGSSVTTGGNRRSIGFHSFSGSEFLNEDGSDDAENETIVDMFDNENIYLVIDGDGDNKVIAAGGTEVYAPVTMYVTGVSNDSDSIAAGAPSYTLYE